ncbi:flagellar basal-body MS-ring/collar protein FliF [Actinomycetaceae bacterium L2_0104]
MPQIIGGFLGRVRGFWDKFSIPQRTFALIAVVAMVLGGVAVFQAANKPTMTALYSGLSAADAQAVVDALSAEGVQYQLTGGGGTVLVPQEQLYDLRVRLASQSIPSNEDGYSLLDDMGMASSDFQQQVTYQRALEGELAKTIRAMDGVQMASVHLALPEDSVFTEVAGDPTASVFIQSAAGKSLDTTAVQAIQTLVAAGVPNMAAASVSVIDASGRDLSMNASGASGAGTSDYEERTARQVQTMLDQVLGPGNAVVNVTAELDNDSSERVTETFSAGDDVPPLSESRTSESYTGASNNATGVLGPDNIAVPADGDGSGAYERTEEVVNNSVNKTTESTLSAPGTRLARQSVSVVVDSEAAKTISTEELRDLVAAASGTVEGRGDTLAVTKTVFDRTIADEAQQALDAAQEQEDAEAAAAERSSTIRTLAIVSIVLIGLLFLLYRFISRRRAAKEEEEETYEETLFEETDLPTFDEVINGPETGIIPAYEPPEADPDELMRTDLATLADEEPEVVAERLRDWLTVKS